MNPISIAIKTETDAISFYREAAQKTKNPVVKKMFLSIIKDEQNHLADYSQLIEGLHLKGSDPMNSAKKLQTVFRRNKETLLMKIRAATDEMGALRLAIQMVRETIEFYEGLSRKVSTRKERVLFDKLLKEELQHYAIFSNTYFFLMNHESWYLWEEQSIADGGTCWA